MKKFLKDPQANLDYLVDWSKYLVSDTISSSTFSADVGITIGVSSHNTMTATVWISGGIVGQSYTITNSIVTAAGRIDERSFVITVHSR